MDKSFAGMSPKKITALVLLIISIFMLLLPWCGMSLKIAGERYSIDDITELLEISRGELKEELFEGIDDIEYEFESEGLRFSSSGAERAVKILLDGKLAPLETGSLSFALSGVFRSLGRIDESEDYYGDIESELIISAMSSAAWKLSLGGIFFWILIIASIATAVLAVLGTLKDDGRAILPYAGASALMLISFIFLTVSINSAVNKAASLIEDAMGFMFYFLELESFDSFNIFALTGWAFLCPILALGAFGLMYFGEGMDFSGLTEKLKALSPGPARGPRRGWKCPGCGFVADEAAAFCPRCGYKREATARRPDSGFKAESPVRCPDCGTIIPDNALFCPHCGRTTAAVPSGPSGKIDEASGKTDEASGGTEVTEPASGWESPAGAEPPSDKSPFRAAGEASEAPENAAEAAPFSAARPCSEAESSGSPADNGEKKSGSRLHFHP